MSTFAILALAGSGLAVTANSASAAASALSCKVVFDDSPVTHRTATVTVTNTTLSGPIPGSASRVPHNSTSSDPTAHCATTLRGHNAATV
ncbi:hypothetical protein [Streptomyces sp. ALI-76-A]|uniref:hypothetical protein n=1 Tax=Streptomyces sp. ALI-76-A TaxID=3025736 RepID=UPI00256EB048|nr:hypothetical protein [Streptomyces sp. ALI-76-A]MDL5205362.1 hypothetical protein [Streptomyces sp. ALI-76-A]